MNLQSFIDQNVFIRHEYYFKKKKKNWAFLLMEEKCGFQAEPEKLSMAGVPLVLLLYNPQHPLPHYVLSR